MTEKWISRTKRIAAILLLLAVSSCQIMPAGQATPVPFTQTAPPPSATATQTCPAPTNTPVPEEKPRLIGEWLFSGNALDTSGYGNDGTIMGAALTADRFNKANQAYSFDGMDDSINCGTKLNFADLKEYSISLWFKWDGENEAFTYRILSKWSGVETPDQISISISEKRGNHRSVDVGFGKEDGYIADYYSTDEPQKGEWVHLVLTSSNGAISLYLNAQPVKFDPPMDGIAYPLMEARDIPLLIGAADKEGYFFWGSIDDVRIYDGVLNQKEITDLYTETK
jgi:hypothetical protein